MTLIRTGIQRRYVAWFVLALAMVAVHGATADALVPVPGQPAAEDFSLKDLNGRAHRLSDYSGKVVLVSFWATWCPECIFEMPSFQALSEALAESEFILLAINVGEDPTTVQTFVQQHNLEFPVLLDEDLRIYKRWPVLGVPTSFVIDQQGKILYSVIGSTDWSSQVTVSKIRALSEVDKS